MDANTVQPINLASLADTIHRLFRRMDYRLAEGIQTAMSRPTDPQRADYDAAILEVLQREYAGMLRTGVHATRLLNSRTYRALWLEHKRARKKGVTDATSEALLHARIFLAGRAHGRLIERQSVSAPAVPAADALTNQ